MKGLGSVASLVEALHEEVDAEVARIRRQAEEEERRLTDAAAAEPVEIPGRLERLAQARRAAAELLAREDWADRREALEEREVFVAETVRQGLERLSQGGEPGEGRALLARLIAEALDQLPGDDFEVVVRESDAALARSELTDLSARRGKGRIRLAVETLPGIGGCVVRTADGRTAMDNRLEARARRFEPVWRAAVAQVYGP